MDIGDDDFIMEMVFTMIPSRPCKGCVLKDNTNCPGGRAVCERCGQEFDVIPQEFNIMHHMKSCWIQPHNAPCGRSCCPKGMTWIGNWIPHFDMESCSICGGGPSEDIVDFFWETYSDKVSTNNTILVSKTKLKSEEIKDIYGHTFDTINIPTYSYLFFVDLFPEANWAHKCAYVFISKNKEFVWLDAEWPPHDSIKLKPLIISKFT
jgi:hypothetical protein